MNLTVIGTGYVGLVSGTCFAEMGNHVICVDNDQSKIKKLQNQKLTIYEPGLDSYFLRNIEKKRLSFTDDLKQAVLQSEIIFLCLPTPQGEDGSADLSYVLDSAEKISDYLKDDGDKNYKIIVNKSTVPVKTGRKVANIFQSKGVKNFDIVSNPEFLREGFAVEDFMKPERIVIGSDSSKALEKMRTLYEPFVRQGNPIIEMSIESAEVTKYAANSFLATKISFMNEIANFCEAVDANIDDVRRGIGTDNRIGKRFLFAGIGYGGACFPKDVNALIKTSKEFNSEINILSTVDAVNKKQKFVLFNKVMKHFNNDVKGKTFSIWGLAFKPNTDDMREAPSITIINKLLENGAKINCYDPEAMESARYYFKDSVNYSDDTYSALDNSDALLILTEWNEFRNPDFTIIKNKLRNNIIFDGRNIFQPEKMKELGFTYYSIGRMTIK